MMVVPVLMTNCQVSLKPKSGRLISYTLMMPTVSVKIGGRPHNCAVVLAKREYQAVFCKERLSRRVRYICFFASVDAT